MLSKDVKLRIRTNKERKKTVAWKHRIVKIGRMIDFTLKMQMNSMIGAYPNARLYSGVLDMQAIDSHPQRVTEADNAPPEIHNRVYVRDIVRAATHHSQAKETMMKLYKVAVQVTGCEVRYA